MKPNVKGMIRKLGGEPPLVASRDWDKDGVSNIVDCEPRNQKRQGLIHDVAAKYGKGRVAAWGERGKKLSAIETEERMKEREKQVKETAIYKEKVRGERQRRIVKAGGFGYYVGGTVKYVGSAFKAPKPKYRYVKKRGKKIKKKLKRARVVKDRPRTASPTDFKLDMPRLF